LGTNPKHTEQTLPIEEKSHLQSGCLHVLLFDRNRVFSLLHTPSVAEREQMSSAITDPKSAEGMTPCSLLVGLMCLVFCPGVAWGYGLGERWQLYVYGGKYQEFWGPSRIRI